jgi:tetratricopeptide (TPR) repeat protein
VYKSVLVFLQCICIAAGLAAAQVPQPSATDKASALLSIGKVYFDAGDYINAEKQILDALAIAPPGSQIRKDIEDLFLDIFSKAKQEKQAALAITRQRQDVHLREARYLLSEGKFDQALALMQKVIIETNDPQLIKEAKDELVKAHPGWKGLPNNVYKHIYVVAEWTLNLISGILIVIVLYILLRLMRWIWAYCHRHKWMIIGIANSTGLGVGELVIASLRSWSVGKPAPVSAGLLKLETLRLPAAPTFAFSEVEFDPTAALESLHLQIGGLDLGAIAKAMMAIRRWMNATRPQIQGSAITSEGQLIVRLTRRSANGKTDTLTGSCKIAQGIDAASIAAEEVSFKMYYLIANKEFTLSKAAATEKLRQGLRQLQQYISGRNPKELQTAYATFRSVHNEDPTIDEVYLYEGITLDLMERHDEAINRFHYLAENTSGELQQKALYNKAISQFRKYIPEELKNAIALLTTLVGENPNPGELAKSPIKAMAWAAKANAIAHRPIFWQQLLFEGNKSRRESEICQRKDEVKEKVKEWISQVEMITEELERVHKRVMSDKGVWDDMAGRQLLWAIQNARGNAFMNYAISFLSPPHLDESQELKQQKEYLEKAYSVFQHCEVLLPPGVETLTNLATVLLFLSRTTDARSYAQLAIDLNPDYEYAYFRCAQSWEKENRKDKVVEVLKSFAKLKTPRIPEFVELYRNYAVNLSQI